MDATNLGQGFPLALENDRECVNQGCVERGGCDSKCNAKAYHKTFSRQATSNSIIIILLLFMFSGWCLI